LFLLGTQMFGSAAHAQRDVPVWYIRYEAILHVDYTAPPTTEGGGTITETYRFDRRVAGSATLDMRNEGSVIVQTRQAMMDAEKMKSMSQAEMMKYSQDMLDAMQYAANWMPGPLEPGDEPDAMMRLMLASSVPVEFQYEATRSGRNMTDELGGRYDFEVTRHGSFSGGKLYLGDQYKFEVNTKSNQYWLVLPYAGQELDPRTRAAWETVEKSRPAGTEEWKDVKRQASDTSIDWLPGFTLDLPANTGTWPVIEGPLGPAGRITGEKTFSGSYTDGPNTIPITLKYRYTVSSNPIPAENK
jgi:hypothetical protein